LWDRRPPQPIPHKFEWHARETILAVPPEAAGKKKTARSINSGIFGRRSGGAASALGKIRLEEALVGCAIPPARGRSAAERIRIIDNCSDWISGDPSNGCWTKQRAVHREGLGTADLAPGTKGRTGGAGGRFGADGKRERMGEK